MNLFAWHMPGVPRVLVTKRVLVTSLFVWCMSGAPRKPRAPCVIDGKTCARDKLIRVVHHVWLMVN